MPLTNIGLETGHEIDKKRMTSGICRLKHTSLRHQTLHLVTSDYVTLLERLDCKVLSSRLILRQQHLTTSQTTVRQCGNKIIILIQYLKCRRLRISVALADRMDHARSKRLSVLSPDLNTVSV